MPAKPRIIIAHVEGSGTGVVIVAEKVASRELFIAEFQTGPSARTLAQTKIAKIGDRVRVAADKSQAIPNGR